MKWQTVFFISLALVLVVGGVIMYKQHSTQKEFQLEQEGIKESAKEDVIDFPPQETSDFVPQVVARTETTDTFTTPNPNSFVKSYYASPVNVPYNGGYVPFEDYVTISEEDGRVKIQLIDGRICYLTPDYIYADKSEPTEAVVNVIKTRGSYYFTTDVGKGVDSMSYIIENCDFEISFENDELFLDQVKIDFSQAKELQNISTEYDEKDKRLEFKAVDGKEADLSFIDPITSYNYTNLSNINAYWSSPTSNSTANRYATGTNASSTQYTNMQTRDGLTANASSDATDDNPWWRFNFTISNNVSYIKWITINITGYANTTGEPAIFRVQNYSGIGNTYAHPTNFNNESSGLNNLSVNFTDNPTHYLQSGGNLTFWMEGNDFDSGEAVKVDFVQVDVGYYYPIINWSNPYTNSTTAGATINHSVNWTANDFATLSGYIFSFSNGDGSFQNDTWTGFPTGLYTSNQSNTTKVVNSTTNSKIKWRVYANDSFNILNVTNTFTYTTSPSCSSAWWNNSYQNRVCLKFNNINSNDDLVNFPVLVVLNTSRINYSNTQNLGQDIRFIDPNNTTLPHEIEIWNESNQSFVWVQVPKIDSGSTDDYIWMYFNNATIGDGQNKTGVWDSNFKGVWHLGNGSTLTANDSTNANNGTLQGTTVTTGQIDGGANLDGSSQYISFGDVNDLTGAFTLSGWFKTTDNTLFLEMIIAKYDQNDANKLSYYFTLISGKVRGFSTKGGGTDTKITDGRTLVSNNTWYYGTIVFSGTTADPLNVYLNGINDTAIPVTNNVDGAVADTTSNLLFGARQAGAGVARYFSGSLDELRISNTNRSAEWIEAEYISGVDALNVYGSIETFSSADTTFPTFSNIMNNNSEPEVLETVLLSVLWADNIALNSSIFSWNATGVGCNTWGNDSVVGLTGTLNWSNFSKQIPATCLLTQIHGIGWRVYVNDSSNNLNVSTDSMFTGTSCTCTNGSAWTITDGDQCTLSTYCALGNGAFRLKSGSLRITDTGKLYAKGCYVDKLSNLFVHKSGGLICRP